VQSLQVLQEGFIRTCQENLEDVLGLQRQPEACAKPSAQSNAASSSTTSEALSTAQEQKGQTLSIQGAYLHGPVGSGKTLLMDLFRSTLPKSIRASSGQELPLQVLRLHFHEFMAGFHQRNHQIQQSLPKMVVKSRSGLPVYRWAAKSGNFSSVLFAFCKRTTVQAAPRHFILNTD
jgi:predicted ATPase